MQVGRRSWLEQPAAVGRVVTIPLTAIAFYGLHRWGAIAHIPLWAVYPEWGWGTQDSKEALPLVRRFASVTVLNGHIHQVLQKTEGNITFHTACSTAFPQPQPGMGESPGPIKNVPAEKLRSMLGLTSVNFVASRRSLAVIDSTLG